MSAPKPAPFPDQFVIAGRWCRLEPLEARHGADLFAAAGGADSDRYRYLPDYAPADVAATKAWCGRARRRPDCVFSAVMDVKADRCVGRQALIGVHPEHARVELGHILWGQGAARTRVATEAVFLIARHVFETLGYRRLEWACDTRNVASRAAALRFGFRFEGVSRQHMIVKAESRDSARFAMLDSDWTALKPAYEDWLGPRNFDRSGAQRTPLATPRES